MFKHNIIDLYKTFSKDEIKRLGNFLLSPYFNSSSKMHRLYSEIIKYYPDFSSNELNKRNLSQSSSFSGKYNESTLRDALSELLKLSLKFLAYESSEKNPHRTSLLILQELYSRSSSKLFFKNLKKLETLMEENYGIDSEHIYNRYCYRVSKFNFGLANEKLLHKNDVISKINDLNGIGFELYRFYIMELVSIYLNAMVLSNKYNIDTETLPCRTLIKKKEIESTLKLFHREDPQPVHLYYSLLAAFESFEDATHYVKYKQELHKNFRSLSRDEHSFHYCWLINYCLMKKKDNSEWDYSNELMDLYNSMLENKLYLNRNSNYLPSDLYRDILLHGIHLKKYTWTAKFIQEYNSELKQGERYNLLNYSFTYLYSSMGNYPKALLYYNNIVMDKFIYKYDIKNIVLKMYYELNYSEEALCEIKSYREFLRNNPMVSSIRRTRTGQFLKYLEQLILKNLNSEKKELEYLRKKLMTEKNVAFKEWLLEKISNSLTRDPAKSR